MPKFWSYISNDQYSVGCTGQTVYLYDKNGTELAKFKNLIYAYTTAFSPRNDIFVVKSTDGRLAVYSLERRCLLKKFRFSKIDESQDDNFCFSPDGEQFYNIERHIKSCRSALSIYRTRDFTLEKQLFLDDLKTELDIIEFDNDTNSYYLLGFLRDNNNIASEFFVAKLCDDELKDIKFISEKEYNFYHEYKKLEFTGFAEKAKKWSGLKYSGYDLNNIENEKYSLAELWDTRT